MADSSTSNTSDPTTSISTINKVQSNWDNLLNNIVNKFHIILGAACQGVVMLYHFKTGKDLGPVVSTTVFAFYGFLLGHSGIYQKWPDQGNQ